MRSPGLVLRTCSRTCRVCGNPGPQVDHDLTGRDAREARENAGLSLREMARRLGYSAAYLSDLELGKRLWRQELIDSYNRVLMEPEGE